MTPTEHTTAMAVTLDDSASEDLAEELDAARVTPDECQYCSEASTALIHGIPMCSSHVRAYDDVEEVTS